MTLMISRLAWMTEKVNPSSGWKLLLLVAPLSLRPNSQLKSLITMTMLQNVQPKIIWRCDSWLLHGQNWSGRHGWKCQAIVQLGWCWRRVLHVEYWRFLCHWTEKRFQNTPYDFIFRMLVWLNENVSVKSIWRSLTSKATSLNST